MEKQDLFLSCPHCRNHIVKSHENDAEVKMRVKLVKWNRKGMFAVCKGCGKDVPVDLEFMKSIQVHFSYVVENLG